LQAGHRKGLVVPNEEEQRRALTVAPGAVTALLKELAQTPSEPGVALPALHPGQVVGRFELLREIGHGGFGVVWEARDRELGRSVAFKAIRAGGNTTLREERLFREAEAAARLQHPNIITLYDVGRCEQGPYLVLELLSGRTLAERKAQGTLTLRDALRIGVEVAKGVAHAHAHGVVHRDLTPGNVFLCDDGQVKVLDFGMAHAFGQRKVDGGTRAYMAPEQARGAPEDERTDVFALGAILHETLSGELPFSDAEALASSSPAPGLEVPEAALGELVGRMLEKDPVKRPRDAGEVLSALTTIQRELERLPSTGNAQVKMRRPSSGFRDLFAELKRRRVMRALLGYAIVSFAILQIAEPVLHGLHLPDSTLSVIVVLLGVGFPITVALAWVFDLTAAGIARTPTDAGTGPRGARLATALIGLGVLAAAPGLAWYFLRQGSTRLVESKADLMQAPTAPSIAVLPFADMSPQKDQEYLSDGIAEEILIALANVEGLRVPGRTSSFWFKGKGAKLAEIGRELNVRSILEGSVRKDGNRVRVTAQLLNVSDGYHLWSETFDRELTDIFRIQDEISRAVAAALEVRFLAGATGKGRGRPARIEAYEQYLLGRQLLNAGTPASIHGAREAFARAVALDEGYAPAHAGLARAYGEVAGFLAQTPEELTRYALLQLASAEQAIALDPALPDGYVARANHRLSYAWDWKGGLADIERAKSLGTGDDGADVAQALALAALDRLPEGLAAARRATEADPLWGWAWIILARMLDNGGDEPGAEVAARRALQVAPDSPAAAYELGIALRGQGRLEEALACFDRNSFEFLRLTGLAITHHALGNARESQAALDELIARYSLVSAFQIAEVKAVRGEPDASFAWLERARLQHDGGLEFVRMDPAFASLRADPRWKPFLRRMNLPVD
jgi:TolB-like protein/tetratricopeptide (TPR) repeat protein